MSKKRGGMGGFGGPAMPGGNNSNAMMKQLQKMQEDMVAAQKALEEETLEVQTGGVVTVVITGHQRVQSIRLNPALLDTSDPDWATDLEDLLITGVNNAIEQSQTMAAERMESITGGVGGMPGLGGLLG